MPPQMVTHQPWQRKAPLLLRVQPVPKSPLLTLGGHRLSWLLGSSLPTLFPLHLTCTSPLNGLRREVPGAGADGVAFPQRAMEVGQKWQTASVQLESRALSCQLRLPPHLSTSHCIPGSPGTGGDMGIESFFGEQGGD